MSDVEREDYEAWQKDPEGWRKRHGTDAGLVWFDPGGRVVHKLKDIVGTAPIHYDVHMRCGAVYPIDQVRPYDPRRDHWRPPCEKCGT